jgi:RNA polymerase sigma factor (sigma-70 family)
MVSRMRTPLLRLQSDERLASLASRGAEPAFEVLVARHRPALVRACGRILRESEAEDAVQQALLSAHQALRRNGAPERFAPWLHRIAINAAVKQLRRTHEDLPLDEERTDGIEQPPQSQERRDRLRETIAAVGALPARQQRALLLREMEGRSHAEIARTLGLTPGAVRQLIHRARAGVRSAVSAVTPYGLLLRLAAGEGEGQFRVAELVGGGAAGALAGKTAVAALVAGSVAGGIALAPEERRGGGEAAAAQKGTQIEQGAAGVSPSVAVPLVREADDDSRRGPNRGSDHDDDRSGPSGSSGPGGGDDLSGSGSSGSGSSGSGSGGSGGDEDSSGSGFSGSATSGSGTSGSGTSGSGTSGSGTSGSGTSGSGTSGSGTSGSGSSDSGSSGSGGDDDLIG